eukprot:1181761-Prorocentrum_minimum.AAC.4
MYPDPEYWRVLCELPHAEWRGSPRDACRNQTNKGIKQTKGSNKQRDQTNKGIKRTNKLKHPLEKGSVPLETLLAGAPHPPPRQRLGGERVARGRRGAGEVRERTRVDNGEFEI